MKKKSISLTLLGVILILTSFWIVSNPKKEYQNSERQIEDSIKLVSNPSQQNLEEEKLKFFENKGQIKVKGYDVKYMLNKGNVSCYLNTDGILYSFLKKKINNSAIVEEHNFDFEMSFFAMNWLGANPDVKVRAENQALEIRNYYKEDKEGITGVRSFQKIIYENLYNQIDLIFYSDGNSLKYDFIVKPGGRVADIKIKYTDNEEIKLTENGEVLIKGEFGEIVEGKPFTYQNSNGIQSEITSSYEIADGVLSFKVDEYNESENLVIDPTLLWATYYGGDEMEYGQSVYTDHLGNVYMSGETYSTFNIYNSGHDGGLQGEFDAYLVKFDGSGNRLWATYYGGYGRDWGDAVCTDHLGNVYLAGGTESTTDIAHNGHDNIYNQTGEAGTGLSGNRFDRDAYLVKFNSEGERLWATYYGGGDFDWTGSSEHGTGVCTDANGNVFMTGYTNSDSGIAFNGHDNSFNGVFDAFIVKFNSFGNRIWGTYFGGTKDDRAYDICADSWGNIHITGYTESDGLGYKNLHQYFNAGNKDAFIAKFNNNGSLYWSTYYGGSEYDEGRSIATDASGSVYVAGMTKSNSNINDKGFDESFNNSGNNDAFLVKFSLLSIRLWGTYYGGEKGEYTSSVAISKNGDVYLAGETYSESGIATNNGYKNTIGGVKDGYLVRFNEQGERQWATYYGGESHESIYGVTTDISANVYVVGMTHSDDNIFHKGFQNVKEGKYDAFLAKFKPYDVNDDNPDGPGDYKDEERPTHDGPNNIIEGKSLGVGETSSSFGLMTYPNPATEELKITMHNQNEERVKLEIFNVVGDNMYQKIIEGEINQSVDVSTWQKGMYIVKLTTPTEEIVQKIIKD